ncbi:hypothetical protein IFM89_033387 [Coptis chinensis]|uniref:Fe2OG dioxygenase domain-containing protein n=1 Tax=Coptis chinensis TaxID=261450 RepID=A0A835HIQ3_9MAGN|nr:hypothetical protein IFM89_033387 [Coptis chinensis]
MSPTMGLGLKAKSTKTDADPLENQYQKGVIHLCDSGIKKVPNKYILPVIERPNRNGEEKKVENVNIKLPIIDFAALQGPNRSQVIKALGTACEEYGFFQVINHDIPHDMLHDLVDVVQRFFELPFEERAKYMLPDLRAPVRYGTSFNQNKDGVFCWRDFLKLMCHPLSDVLPSWPSSPVDLRETMVLYSKQTKIMFEILMDAVLESLGLASATVSDDEVDILKQCEEGSQLMVANCYPSCPEPDLTLGMPPHSDYGFLTLLLQGEAEGLQIQHKGKWLTVKPLQNSFVVNIGDHLEIFSNGRYKSVLHRVLVNSSKTRISVASLHSLSYNTTVRPCSKLINEANPRLYKDTDFASFIEYITTCEPKKKNFLESRKLN